MNEIQVIILILAMMVILWVIKDIQLIKLETKVRDMNKVVVLLCNAAIQDHDSRHKLNKASEANSVSNDT